MERYNSIWLLGFSMDVIGSTLGTNDVKTLAMTALQLILAPSLITVDILALVVPYLFTVWLIDKITNS